MEKPEESCMSGAALRFPVSRRAALGGLAGLGAMTLFGCGGGGSSDEASSSSSSGSSSSSSSSSSPWVWASAGTSTTATVPTLADFVEVIGSGTVAYAFHASATSSTTDPLTGVTSDTSSSATLVSYFMGKYLVTNANWMAFCNAMGSSYYPSTSRTAGQYWYGGTYPSGKETHPVFFVSYTAAQAYCAWLSTQISGHDFYVPTEGEWEYAALGSNTGYSFPWGAAAGISYSSTTGSLSTVFNSNAVCAQYVLNSSGLSTLTYDDDSVVTTLSDGTTALTKDTAPLTSVLSMNSSGGVTGWQYDSDTNKTWADFANSDQFHDLVYLYGGYTTGVGTYESGKSWCGCYDMAGNAFEWTSTLNTATNGLEAGSQVNCVKGGSWYATSASGKSSGRGEGRSASGAYHSVGFRVAARAK